VNGEAGAGDATRDEVGVGVVVAVEVASRPGERVVPGPAVGDPTAELPQAEQPTTAKARNSAMTAGRSRLATASRGKTRLPLGPKNDALPGYPTLGLDGVHFCGAGARSDPTRVFSSAIGPRTITRKSSGQILSPHDRAMVSGP